MTASLLQSQYAQGETGNNERFSTPAVHIILGSWHLESSAETKILELTMGFLNLLNIKTFPSSERFHGGSEKIWGGGTVWIQLQRTQARTDVESSFPQIEKEKKNHIVETKGRFCNWQCGNCTEVFSSNTYERATVVLLLCVSGQLSKK